MINVIITMDNDYSYVKISLHPPSKIVTPTELTLLASTGGRDLYPTMLPRQ